LSFNFPLAPALNDTYAPVGGPVFTWDGVAWKGTSQGAPVTVYVSDTAPLTPAIGQLWWNSATGTMAIWYADSDSAQWVQVSGQVLPTAPSDNGEYVMVNGVWRLVRQEFNPAGVTSFDISVPAWGPSQARLTLRYFFASGTNTLVMQISTDGTTFPSTSGNYAVGGFTNTSGSTGYTKQGNTPGTGWTLTPSTDRNDMPLMADVVVLLKRYSNANNFMYYTRGEAYHSAAGNLFSSIYWQGYAAAAAFPGTGPVVKMRFLIPTAPVFASISVDWLA
jgi:hypothetical protein